MPDEVAEDNAQQTTRQEVFRMPISALPAFLRMMERYEFSRADQRTLELAGMHPAGLQAAQLGQVGAIDEVMEGVDAPAQSGQADIADAGAVQRRDDAPMEAQVEEEDDTFQLIDGPGPADDAHVPAAQTIEVAAGNCGRFYSFLSAHPRLNRLQSEAHPLIFDRDNHLVVVAPTSAGKTGVASLAFMKTWAASEMHMPVKKVIYVAPTKALVAERQTDWQLACDGMNGVNNEARMSQGGLGFRFVPLDGDSAREAYQAALLVQGVCTTPEKLLSLSERAGADIRLSRWLAGVGCVVVDEVHLVGEERGPTLELLIARIKAIDLKIRIIALTASASNVQDLQKWIGDRLLPNNETVPSTLLDCRSSVYRSTHLQKHIFRAMDILEAAMPATVERRLYQKLYRLVTTPQLGDRKSTLVFVNSRMGTERAGKALLDSITEHNDVQWPRPQDLSLQGASSALKNEAVASLLRAGIGIHHAGLTKTDRQLVENLYRDGTIKVLCCTYTLAIGINLPTHCVICVYPRLYNGQDWKDRRTADIHQACGRAGRGGGNGPPGHAVVLIPGDDEVLARLERGWLHTDTPMEPLESGMRGNLLLAMAKEVGTGLARDEITLRSLIRRSFWLIRAQYGTVARMLEEAAVPGVEYQPAIVGDGLVQLDARTAEGLVLDMLMALCLINRGPTGGLAITPYGRFLVENRQTKASMQFLQAVVDRCHAMAQQNTSERDIAIDAVRTFATAMQQWLLSTWDPTTETRHLSFFVADPLYFLWKSCSEEVLDCLTDGTIRTAVEYRAMKVEDPQRHLFVSLANFLGDALRETQQGVSQELYRMYVCSLSVAEEDSRFLQVHYLALPASRQEMFRLREGQSTALNVISIDRAHDAPAPA